MSLTGFITAFYTKLNTLADRVYYGESIDPAVKIPYVYFNYTSSSDIEKLEDFIIEVDVIGNYNNIDSLVQDIDGNGNINNPTGLNYYHYGSGARPTFRCFRLSRLSIPTNDEIRARRQLRYRVRVYV